MLFRAIYYGHATRSAAALYLRGLSCCVFDFSRVAALAPRGLTRNMRADGGAPCRYILRERARVPDGSHARSQILFFN